jgi:hypothetical protein
VLPHSDGGLAGRGNGSGDFFRALGVDIGDDDIRAGRGKTTRCGFAEP